jgi:sugar phosphate isomerase/epimerase
LERAQCDAIAEALRRELTREYQGGRVGWHPRIGALATFFPNASLPELEMLEPRTEAVKALRNSVYLAHLLGCHCVEIVGGAGVPGPRSSQHVSPAAHRRKRLKALADSITSVFDRGDPSNPVHHIPSGGRWPLLAVELEPGPSFLLNSLDAFDQLCKLLPNEIRQWVGLNIDVAHAFLIGYQPEEVRRRFFNRVIHFHISDHAGDRGRGIHASDLVPGSFHVQNEYQPWLTLAMELTSKSERFSGALAVEMEAVNDVGEASRAVRITQRWLRELSDKDSAQSSDKRLDWRSVRRGAILVVDIGNSTAGLLKRMTSYHAAPQLEEAMTQFFQPVFENSGSIMSFTGDGLIALFEQSRFARVEDAARKAWEAAIGLRKLVRLNRTGPAISLRIALHWGETYVPNSGPLRNQIMGGHVVLTTRVCDWLAKTIEEKKAPRRRGVLIAATDQFYRHSSRDVQDEFEPKGVLVKIKGLIFPSKTGKFKVHVDRQFVATRPLIRNKKQLGAPVRKRHR